MNSASQALSFSADYENPEKAPADLIGRIWRSLNSSSPKLDAQTIQRCQKITTKDAIDFFKLLKQDFFVLKNATNERVKIADCFCPEALRQTLRDSKRNEFKLQADLGLLNSQDRLCDDSHLDILPFQESLLRFGKLFISCPFTGEAKASDQSFFVQAKGLMYNYILYRFIYDNNAYYLITGGVQGNKIGLYFPSKNLIVTTESSLENAFRHSLSIFCAKVIVNCSDVLEYLRYSQKKDSCLCLFYSKQFAHSMLADISGFYASLYILLAKRDIQYIIGDNLLMNPSSIFNFIDPSKLLYEDCDQAFIFSLRQKRLLIRVTRNNIISNDFEAYIRSASMSQIDNNVRGILKSLVGKRPIVHYVLRKKRTWDDDIDGIIFIFLELQKNFPNSVLIIDGPTSFYNAEGDKITNDYAESKLAKKIQESLPLESCFSIIGMSFPEKIIIVNQANFSIGPFGAGSSLSLLLRIPSILLTSKANFPGNILKDLWIRFRPDLSVLSRFVVDSDPVLDSGNFSIDRQVILNHCLEMASELMGNHCND